MKKVYMLGMVLTLAACFAYAASLSVPWYVDNAGVPGKLPPVTAGVMGLVYLHNNLGEVITCEIEYYSQDGVFLGPEAPDPTTFTIPALSTVAFRPFASDPVTPSSGGQETEIAMAIPNRPTDDGKKNGSLIVKWTTGGSDDVQGILLQTQNVQVSGTTYLLQWGTLLPPGVG